MVIDQNTDNIQRFFTAIEPWEAAYTHAGLSYFAIRKNGVLNLLLGRLFLRWSPSTVPHVQFETNHVLAGFFTLAELKLGHRDVISQMATSGRIQSPIGELVLVVAPSQRVAANFSAFHPELFPLGRRTPFLSLVGTTCDSYMQQPDIDWELKAAVRPFDTLGELLFEYSLGGPQSLGDFQNKLANVEIIAMNVAEINLGSVVDGEEASPSIYLAKSLDPNKCHIGCRVFHQGKVVSRESISGSKFRWIEQDVAQMGVGKLEIPLGAVLHCVVSYAGIAQHQGWLADAKNFQNPRRAVLEEFDDKLGTLRDYLFEEQKARKGARDFEFGVAWLMWMLGFNVAQPGATARTSDAADIVATTPKGNIAIVECTIGLLQADNKLPKLVDRFELVRKRIASSGYSHLKLLPVIVTAKTRNEVRADLEQAQKLGVAVVIRELLEELLSQTVIAADADTIFDRALQATEPKQE